MLTTLRVLSNILTRQPQIAGRGHHHIQSITDGMVWCNEGVAAPCILLRYHLSLCIRYQVIHVSHMYHPRLYISFVGG